MKVFEEKFNQFFCDLKKLSLEDKEYIFYKLQQVLATTEFSSVHALNMNISMKNLVIKHGMNISNSKILEIGSGKYSLLTALLWLIRGASCYVGIDKYCDAFQNDFWVDIYKSQIRAHFETGSQVIKDILNNNWDNILNRFLIFKHDFLNVSLDCNSYDFVYSLAVMEHIEEPQKTIEKSFKLLKSGGLCYHNIDLKPHGHGQESAVEILKYSSEEWSIMKKSWTNWTYLNRLRASEWEQMFKNFDFEILSISRGLFSKQYGDEIYTLIAPEFKSYSLDDLNTSSFNILCRKR